MTSPALQAREAVNRSQLVQAKEWILGVTIGYGQLQHPINNQDDIELFIIPDIRYYGEKFSVENLNVSYALIEKPNMAIELVGKQNIDGIYFPGNHRYTLAAIAGKSNFGRGPNSNNISLAEAIASERITPQHKSMSYMAGVELRKYGNINYFITALYDISNVHHGYEFDINIHFQHELGELSGDFEVGLVHKSDKMSDYYYGVDYSQFKQNNHSLNSTNNWYLQYTVAYALSQKWFLLGVIKQQWFDSDIQHSPVVAHSNILSYFAGIKYMY